VKSFVYWMVGLSSMHGLLYVIPASVLYDSMPCGDCGTELCFGESAICQMNKTSIFVLQAIFLCVLWFAVSFLQEMIGIGAEVSDLNSRKNIGHVLGLSSLAVAGVSCAISFYLELSLDDMSQAERDFHMARAGFSCYPRLKPMEQLILLQLVFVVGGLIVFVILSKVFLHIYSIIAMALRMSRAANRHSWRAVWHKTRPVRVVFILCANVFITVCLWITITVHSVPEFELFLSQVDEWYHCKVFDYAQEGLHGVNAWETMRDQFGVDCGPFPEERPSVLLQQLRYAAEVFIPFMVAISFSMKIVARSAVRMCTVLESSASRTKDNGVSIVPLKGPPLSPDSSCK